MAVLGSTIAGLGITGVAVTETFPAYLGRSSSGRSETLAAEKSDISRERQPPTRMRHSLKSSRGLECTETRHFLVALRMGRWQMNAGGRGFRGRDAGETTGSRLDSHEIRGLCFLYSAKLELCGHPPARKLAPPGHGIDDRCMRNLAATINF